MIPGRAGAALAAAVLFAGCSGSTSAPPGRVLDAHKPTPTVVETPGATGRVLPVPPPPEVVQILTLSAPSVRDRVTLTKTLGSVPGETAGTVTTYTSSGSIGVTDDLGRWTFAYVPVAVEDTTLKLPRLLALGLRFQSAVVDTLAIDWEDSVLTDATGKQRRIIHRDHLASPGEPRASVSAVKGGSILEDWVLPSDEVVTGPRVATRQGHAFFETLAPGTQVRLLLTLRRGGERMVKTFVFEAQPLRSEAPSPRPVTAWVGESFVVLPRPASRSREPYEALRPVDPARRPPAPDEIAGAVLKVTAVGYDRLEPVVTLVRDRPREEYTARPAGGSIEGLAPLADVLAARSRWVGKTLWLAEPDLETREGGASGAGVLAVKRFTPVEVTEVTLGWSSAAPVRFVLRTPGGRTGIRDVHTTGTNVPESLRTRRTFAQAFFTEDPRTEFDWPADVWIAIEDGRVVVGMTAEQARLSWGAPRRIERAVSGLGHEEIWTYAGRPALALVDGVVTRIGF